MSTGPAHYEGAEALLADILERDSLSPEVLATVALAYATLANAAATAEAIAQKHNGRSPKHDNTIAREWTEAIS